MPNVYDGYPEKKTDKEIKVILKEYTDEIFKSRADINTVLQWTPLIQLGQAELQGRSVKRVTRASFFISAISILIAISSLWISNQNSTSSGEWESKQIESLNNIKSSIEKQSQMFETELKENNTILNDIKEISKEKEKTKQFTTKNKQH